MEKVLSFETLEEESAKFALGKVIYEELKLLKEKYGMARLIQVSIVLDEQGEMKIAPSFAKQLLPNDEEQKIRKLLELNVEDDKILEIIQS